MPTFTSIALDRLIESGASKSMSTPRNVPIYKQERGDPYPSTREERVYNSKHERSNTISSTTTTIDAKHPWVRITPALYATPEPTPLPDSPSSFPPSPYVINHKRRGARLLKSSSEHNVASSKQVVEEKVEQVVEEKKVDENGEREEDATDLAKDENRPFSFPVSIEVEHVNGTVDRSSGPGVLDNNLTTRKELIVQTRKSDCAELSLNGSELDDFFDPQESMSAKSNTDGEGSSRVDRSLSHSTPLAEFYDAWEELSSESGPQPPPRDVEAELREMRLSLLMEIEKRKQAEEVLDSMRTQWLKIREQLALVGITLPADPVAQTEAEQLHLDLAEELSRQLYIVQFVSSAIGRGTAKAEVEMEMEARIESKNFDIARLCDKLQYYEAVNREMSQRNQETIETARRLRQRRKKKQRWVWCAIAATITLGSGALAWSYMSTGTESSSTSDSHASEHEPLHK